MSQLLREIHFELNRHDGSMTTSKLAVALYAKMPAAKQIVAEAGGWKKLAKATEGLEFVSDDGCGKIARSAGPKKAPDASARLTDEVWEAMSVDERKAHARKKRREERAKKEATRPAPEGDYDDETWAAMSEDDVVTVTTRGTTMGMTAAKKYEISKAEMEAYPRAAFNGTVHIVTTDKEEEEIRKMLKLSSWRVKKGQTLGLDTETKPVYVKGGREPVSLVQICGGKWVVIWDLLRLKHIPPGLKELLSSKEILKVGVGVKQDGNELVREHEVVVRGLIDIGPVAKGLKCQPQSLQGLTALFTNHFLSKDQQMSDWGRRPLSDEQILYAATDAHVSREVFLKMVDLPGAAKFIKPQNGEKDKKASASPASPSPPSASGGSVAVTAEAFYRTLASDEALLLKCEDREVFRQEFRRWKATPAAASMRGGASKVLYHFRTVEPKRVMKSTLPNTIVWAQLKGKGRKAETKAKAMRRKEDLKGDIERNKGGIEISALNFETTARGSRKSITPGGRHSTAVHCAMHMMTFMFETNRKQSFDSCWYRTRLIHCLLVAR